MDFQNTNLQGGSLQISTEVIGKIARCAALEIDGVAEVSCGKQNKKLKDLLEASSIQSPVTVEMRDGTASITLNLMVSFGARIPAVAEKVQENVKTAVQNMTNVTVSRVNLVVITDAVELTKKYGAAEDYQFVNGLLGAVARDHGLDADAAAEQAEQ